MYQQSISGNAEFADGTDKRRLIYSNYYLRILRRQRSVIAF